MIDKKKRGERLRRWRGKDSLEQIAAAACVSRTTITNWENGVGEPRLSQAHALERHKPGFMAAFAPDARAA